MQEAKPKEENQLLNILFNVLLPVLILSYLSKDPALQERMGKPVHPWQLGPVKAVSLALLLPIGYFIYHFARTRRANFMSVLGLFSVGLSGALTIYLWNKDGTVKPNASLLFGIKEGLIPLTIAAAIVITRRSETPLIRSFIYNDNLFDIPRIETKVEELGVQPQYDKLIDWANALFAASFVLSAVLNVVLAQWLFRNFDSKAPDALEKYNGILGTIHWVGFIAVGAPLVAIFFFIVSSMMKKLQALTGLEEKDITVPR